VPAQETTTPRKTAPPISVAVPGWRAAGTASCPVTAATGRPASATAPVATPTTVDQLAGETAWCRVRNRVLASAYQVQRATAPQAAMMPTAFSPAGRGR
jgi:hypothetical protein